MMIREFVDRTGFEPTATEYAAIEEKYYSFDGSKDEFCKAWVKDGGIQRLTRQRAEKNCRSGKTDSGRAQSLARANERRTDYG